MLSAILIGFSLSMDAFAIALAASITSEGPMLRRGLTMSACFGLFQFIMPLLGAGLAGAVSGYVTRFGPYISFFLLAFVGGRMILGARRSPRELPAGRRESFTLLRLLALAVATSIDAFAVGVGFAFMPEIQLLPSCLIIGAVTFGVCLFGSLAGRLLPRMKGSRAEILGGAVLIAIGLRLLIKGVFL